MDYFGDDPAARLQAIEEMLVRLVAATAGDDETTAIRLTARIIPNMGPLGDLARANKVNWHLDELQARTLQLLDSPEPPEG